MSYKEFVEATTNTGEDNSIVMGKSARIEEVNDAVRSSSIRVHYYVGSMSDATDRLFVEDIMSRSLLSMNELTKIGDVCVFREDSSFTKDGDYIVAIKYGEVHDENEPAKSSLS